MVIKKNNKISMKILFLLTLMLNTAFASLSQAKAVETPFEYKVYGWTSDSRFWSFGEKGDYGCGMVYLPGIGLYIIDAAENKFHYKFFKTTDYKGDEEASRADAQVRDWQNNNLKRLTKEGFSNITVTPVYQKPKGTWLDHDGVMVLHGEKAVTFKHKDSQYDVKLDDKYMSEKSKFTIGIKKNGGSLKILQSDKSHWRNFIDYGIVYISISPDDKRIAILVEAVARGLEGTKESRFLGITGPLPEQ